MPLYQYICEFGHILEEFQSIKQFNKNRVVECPECSNTMERYFEAPPLGFVHQEPTTIGQLGESNFKKLGKIRGEEMMIKRQQDEDAARRAQGCNTKEEMKRVKKIASLTKDQQRRYIHTGKLPPG
jgi:putative FmdB family regulatory protein